MSRNEVRNMNLLLPIVSGGGNGGGGRAHGGASIRRDRFDAGRDNPQRIRQQFAALPLAFLHCSNRDASYPQSAFPKHRRLAAEVGNRSTTVAQRPTR